MDNDSIFEAVSREAEKCNRSVEATFPVSDSFHFANLDKQIHELSRKLNMNCSLHFSENLDTGKATIKVTLTRSLCPLEWNVTSTWTVGEDKKLTITASLNNLEKYCAELRSDLTVPRKVIEDFESLILQAKNLEK